VNDPAFSTAKGRATHALQLATLLDEWASTRTVAECEAILTRANVPCSRYSTIRETLQDSHVEHPGSCEMIDDGGGSLKVPNPPFQLRNVRVKARNYVPSLGADNTDVLENILNYSRQRIAGLYDRKILYSRQTQA
jgi:CoA:oxalate CoA-transferase